MLAGQLLTLVNVAFQGSGLGRGDTMIRMVLSQGDVNALCFKYADPENLATSLEGEVMFRGDSMLPRH